SDLVVSLQISSILLRILRLWWFFPLISAVAMTVEERMLDLSLTSSPGAWQCWIRASNVGGVLP
uniref:Uncharacterized protein n=1 Tax=Triticum urartu TaxID=4572 RepID=A0A8R7Q8T2_TRIUA